MFVSHSVLHHMICLSYCRKWKCFYCEKYILLWRLSKWFLNVHFWVNYPFNINLHTCTVWYVCFNTLALFCILPNMFPCDRQCIYLFFFFFCGVRGCLLFLIKGGHFSDHDQSKWFGISVFIISTIAEC